MLALAQVLLEALYFSVVAKRLHPDEDDTLVESPAVTPVSERVPRVRPPHGFALFLAKEEARKVKRLHGMLRVSSGPTLAPGLPSWPPGPGNTFQEGPPFLKTSMRPPPSAGGLGFCGPSPSRDLLPSLMGPWCSLLAFADHVCPQAWFSAPASLAVGTLLPSMWKPRSVTGCTHGAPGWVWLTPGPSLPPRAFWFTCSSCW